MSIKEELYRGFENIPTRVGRGGSYAYVKWLDVADRMNQVFGVGWSSELKHQEIVDGNIIVRVRVTIIDPETKCAQYQEGFGGAVMDARIEAGNPFKAAYSKAFKDACKKWGVALYLDEEGEGPSYGTEPSHTTIPGGFKGRETAIPSPKFTPSAPPIDSNNDDSDGLPIPPGVSMSMSGSDNYSIPETKSNKSMDIPPIPEPVFESKSNVEKKPLENELPMSKVLPIQSFAGDEEELISDVQQVALNSILNMKGADYETIAREAFELNGLNGKKIPLKEKLTYEQAVHVIKHGNDKFRNR